MYKVFQGNFLNYGLLIDILYSMLGFCNIVLRLRAYTSSLCYLSDVCYYGGNRVVRSFTGKLYLLLVIQLCQPQNILLLSK